MVQSRSKKQKSYEPTITIAYGVFILIFIGFHYVASTATSSATFFAEDGTSFTQDTLYTDQLGKEKYIVEFIMHTSIVHPSLYRISPDDCLDALYVNEQEIAFSTPFCWPNIRTVPLGTHLKPGVNIIRAHLWNDTGVAGMSIQSIKKWDLAYLVPNIMFFLLSFLYGLYRLR